MRLKGDKESVRLWKKSAALTDKFRRRAERKIRGHPIFGDAEQMGSGLTGKDLHRLGKISEGKDWED